MPLWTSGLVPLGTQNSYQLDPEVGITITAPVSTNTKGSWTEIVASVPFDVNWIGLTGTATDTSAADTGQLMDIGVGASTFEKVLIPNIPTGYGTLNNKHTWFPIFVPSGTRLSARIQAVITEDIVAITTYLIGSTSWQGMTFQAIDSIGAVTSSASAGTDLSGSGIVELVASSSNAYKGIGVSLDLGVGGNFGGDDRLIEVFVGAGAAEKSVIDNIWLNTGSAENVAEHIPPAGFIPMFVDIPAGTRISAQAIGARDVGIVVHGFR